MSDSSQSAQPDAYRIFIVDDHPVFREGLRAIINQKEDYMVCGEASGARAALRQIQADPPDLVLSDINMETQSGLELMRNLNAILPDLPVLVLSMHDEEIFAERSLKAGARGYVMKHAGTGVLMQAIEKVRQGKTAVSPAITEKLLQKTRVRRTDSAKASVEQFTDREFEIFRLIGEGLDTAQISEQLHLSPKTVDVHRANIRRKLHLETGTQLTQYAIRWVVANEM